MKNFRHFRQIRAMELKPASLIREHLSLLVHSLPPGTIVDLAGGDGHNGIYLALHGLTVTCCDYSRAALRRAKKLAQSQGVSIGTRRVDLEQEGVNPLYGESFSAVLVFRYLHRPLIPHIRAALKPGGLIFYETYTRRQPRFGKPHNPHFLLRPGELLNCFGDYHLIHYFEGVKIRPRRAIAQLISRKA